MIQVVFPVTPERIPEECKRLREAISGHKQEIQVLAGMLRAIQDSCKHKHERTGYDQREGSWATPCVYCGYSY